MTESYADKGVKTTLVRGEHILIGFFRGFFGQSELFRGVTNEFVWTNNQDENSLVIETSGVYDQDTPNSLPSIVLQDTGSQELEETIDRRGTSESMMNTEYHVTNFRQSYTCHCMARRKGAARLLQDAVLRSVGMFRKALYQMGIDHIYPMQAHPAQNLANADDTPGHYDCAVTVPMKMRQNWILSRTGEPEEYIEATIYQGLTRIEFDEFGNITNPGDIVQQTDLVDQPELWGEVEGVSDLTGDLSVS